MALEILSFCLMCLKLARRFSDNWGMEWQIITCRHRDLLLQEVRLKRDERIFWQKDCLDCRDWRAEEQSVFYSACKQKLRSNERICFNSAQPKTVSTIAEGRGEKATKTIKWMKHAEEGLKRSGFLQFGEKFERRLKTAKLWRQDIRVVETVVHQFQNSRTDDC